jgi:hypothetical protein
MTAQRLARPGSAELNEITTGALELGTPVKSTRRRLVAELQAAGIVPVDGLGPRPN